MVTEPRSDEIGPRAQEHMRTLLRAPKIAWGTVALVAALGALWSFALASALLGWLPLAGSTLVATLATYAAFTGMHEAAHLSLGRDRRLSMLAGELCATVLLVRFQAFRQVHLRHHRFTNEPHKDPDRWTGIGPRWQRPFRWATTDLNYYREFNARELRIPMWQDALSWGSLIALVAALVGLFVSGHGWAFVWAWLVPARIALFLSAYVADYVPHMRPHGPPKSDHRYRHTAVIRGRGLGVLLLGHDLHLVHHLYPAVPFYRCARIWRVQRAHLLAEGAREVSLFSGHDPSPDKDTP